MADMELFDGTRNKDGDQVAVFWGGPGTEAFVMFSYDISAPQLVKFDKPADAMKLYIKVARSWEEKGLLAE